MTEDYNNIAKTYTVGTGEDTFTVNIDTANPGQPYTQVIDTTAYEWPELTFDVNLIRPDYKFNEGKLIEEFKHYIDSTYGAHYSEDKFQATEFIIDGGHGTGFCIGNILKYAQRYGKKGTHTDARKDLMKVLHYALIQLYVHDLTSDEDKEN